MCSFSWAGRGVRRVLLVPRDDVVRSTLECQFAWGSRSAPSRMHGLGKGSATGVPGG